MKIKKSQQDLKIGIDKYRIRVEKDKIGRTINMSGKWIEWLKYKSSTNAMIRDSY